MPDVSGIASTPLPAPAASRGTVKDSPERIQDAACQFESLMMAQLMKSMHESDKGWLGDSGDDQAGSTATELAEEQFAQALARQGGLGLARMVVSGLHAQTEPASTT